MIFQSGLVEFLHTLPNRLILQIILDQLLERFKSAHVFVWRTVVLLESAHIQNVWLHQNALLLIFVQKLGLCCVLLNRFERPFREWSCIIFFLTTALKAAFRVKNVSLLLFNLTNFADKLSNGAFLVWIDSWQHERQAYILNFVLFLQF